MPQLSDPRHESFAHFVAGGASQTQAATNAGFGLGAANQGSRLAKRKDIQQRIAELSQQEQAIEPSKDKTALIQSKPWLATETVNLYRVTKRKGEFST